MQLKRDTLLERGKYRILETLGRGGFGITYLAEQVMTRRKVCIKEYFPKDYYNRDADTNRVYIGSQVSLEAMHKYKEKFIKEASVLAHLKHPHIVSVYDVFEENDTAYYVMEYVEGESLNAFVKRCGALDETKAVGYIRQIADALGYIHEQNINHLDVKPGNVMVSSEDDSAILIDFGLAKHYDTSGGQTSSTPVGISHGYAPFEQYKTGGVSSFSPATDIYSLGATLYYLVTGEVPPSATDIGKDGIKTPDNLSPGVQRAIKEAMNYWREERPQSIEAFLALLDDSSVVTPVVDSSDADDVTVIDVENTVVPKPQPKPKKSKRGLWLGIFLFVVAAVASFILFSGGSSKKEGASKSAVAMVDTLQLNDTPKEQPKEQPKPSEAKSVTKPEPPTKEPKEEPKPSETQPVAKPEPPTKEPKEEPKPSETQPVAKPEPPTKEPKEEPKPSEARLSPNQMFPTKEDAKPEATKPVTPTKEDAKTVIQPNNEIWYTSSDGKVVKPYEEGEDIFGAEIESNTYKDGKGIIKFKGDVTRIGYRAFERSSNLKSVTIPNSVTTIGGLAFRGCISLKEFKSKFASKDGRCLIIDGELVAFAPAGITEYTIPNSVTMIGEYAFSECWYLSSVTIPDSVTTIGEYAFIYCSSLTSVTIPNSVTTIGGLAFRGCRNLKEFKSKFASPDGRCLIVNGKLVAFAPAGITEYTIPNSVTMIGEYAFSECWDLSSVTIPNSVTTIGEHAFYDCKSLTSVTIPNSVKTIGEWAFPCCGLTSITIPNSVTTIGAHAFFGCSNLTSVTIPNSVTTIGKEAFCGCESLTSVTIPNSVKTIGGYAFAYCSNLTSVTIPNSVKSIGEYAFFFCDNLSKETKKKIKSINPNAL